MYRSLWVGMTSKYINILQLSAIEAVTNSTLSFVGGELRFIWVSIGWHVQLKKKIIGLFLLHIRLARARE